MAAPRELAVSSDFLARVLRGEERMLCDGGMGTLIQQAGLSSVHEVPDLLNLTHPEEIRALQRRYVEAGSDCVATNTFNSNRLKLEGAGASVAEVYAAAARIAREAGARLVAGDIGPTGALMEPLGPLSFDEAYEIFAEQASAAQAAGCDLVFIETFTDLLEAKAAVLASLDATTLPIFCTMSFSDDGRSVMGTTPQIAASVLSALGANAVGINCSLGPDEIAPLAAAMKPYARCPLMVQPNAGLPRIDEDGATVFDVGPEEFCAAMEGILASSATIVGGCCGTTPAHIALLRRLLDESAWTPVDAYRPSLIATSGQAMVELEPGSHDIAVIGERINPTGKKRLQEALSVGDYDYVVSEASTQVAAGADVLDVNVGMPGLDEPAVLAAVMRTLQSTVTAPLQLDSSNPAALEAACRAYIGKPLINSVNGKEASLAEVLPIAARYGASLVCLTLDEDGIPPSAEERLAIARRIVDAALEAGIPREDLLVDCLTMSAATNQAEIAQILDAVSACKRELGVRTVLGVSNVSFGLPARSIVNASFLTAALARGLDMPILNPLEPRYQDALRSYKVLNGQDDKCMGYIDAYAGYVAPESAQAAAPANAPQEETSADDPAAELRAAILSGRREGAALSTRMLLESLEVTAIASDVLSPALDEVGRRYDEGTYFLPQLMASAEAAKAAFDILSEAMSASPNASQQEGKPPIVMATVEGDIHDIGKNIVIMLLENYGFEVIDLGKNVTAQAILDAVRVHDAKLVGLSALMTTTVGSMEQAIELLHAQAPEVVIMAGGAVLTEDYAKRIGADFYAADAAASVRVAQEVL